MFQIRKSVLAAETSIHELQSSFILNIAFISCLIKCFIWCSMWLLKSTKHCCYRVMHKTRQHHFKRKKTCCSCFSQVVWEMQIDAKLAQQYLQLSIYCSANVSFLFWRRKCLAPIDGTRVNFELADVRLVSNKSNSCSQTCSYTENTLYIYIRSLKFLISETNISFSLDIDGIQKSRNFVYFSFFQSNTGH